MEQAVERVAKFTGDIRELVEVWEMAPLVESLQALRGVQLVTAVIIAAELGDLSRFETVPQLWHTSASSLQTEHSSGGSKQRGRITRTGNSHVRRSLVKAAWAYRLRASMSTAIRERNEGVPAPIRDIAWKAQERLHRRYARMIGRGMCKQKAVTAIARKLAGFVWGNRPGAEEARYMNLDRAAQPASDQEPTKGNPRTNHEHWPARVSHARL